jgi:hypothetical protein
VPRLNSLAAQAAATPSQTSPPATAAAQAATLSQPSSPPPATAAVRPPDQTSLPVPAVTAALQRYAVARPLNVEPPGSRTTYALVYHPQCKRALAITSAIPGVREGQVIVLRADESIHLVHKLHLVDAEQFWVEMLYDDGKILAVSSERQPEDSPLKEHIESLIVCYTPAGVVAARATWRKTRSKFAKVMAVALRQRDGRWREFTGTPAVESGTNRTTGKPYTVITAHVGPINSDEAKALQQWHDDPAAQAEFDAAAAAYEERVRELESKLR